MAEFLVCPYPNFRHSAAVFELVRLRHSIDRIDSWVRTPTLTPPEWRGFVSALKAYGNELCKELVSRLTEYGVNSQCHSDILTLIKSQEWHPTAPYCTPPWFGRDYIHHAHRKYLAHINPRWYEKFWDCSEPNLTPLFV